MTGRFLRACASLGAVVLLVGSGVEIRAQVVNMSDLLNLRDFERDSGSTLAPVFHGWEPNADGTVSLYFGYFNRNFKEEVDVPVGPNNFFQPEPQDQGQPAHFRPRYQQKIFKIVVPRTFKGQYIWTLTMRGNTESVKASLDPTLEIFFTSQPLNPNKPPQITDIGPAQVITRSQAATLKVTVVDDGLPATNPPGSGLAVRWSKYRGPGEVTFSNPSPPIRDGVAETTATFSEPGTYGILVTAEDGSRTQPIDACCWATAVATVTVNPDSDKK